MDPQIDAYFQHLLEKQAEYLKKDFLFELRQREDEWNEKEEKYIQRVAALQTQVEDLAQDFSNMNGLGGGDTDMQDASASDDRPQLYSEASGNQEALPLPKGKHPARQLSKSSSSDRQLRPRDPQTGQVKPAINSVATFESATKTNTKGKAKSSKRPSEVHRLLKEDLPEDIGGLKEALNLHVRILWGLVESKNVPPEPSATLLATFDSRVSSNEQLEAIDEASTTLIPTSIVAVCSKIKITDSRKVARQVFQVEESILLYIQSRLAQYGLQQWCPDLKRTPYSLYNSACRIVALDTFRQALISHAYAHLQPNISYANDVALLNKLYDHRVHHFYSDRYRKEARTPGSVEARDSASSNYQGRKRLADSRYNFAKSIGLPTRYLKMLIPKATSDDEADPSGRRLHGRDVYLIRKRPERSIQAEKFIRLLEKQREEQQKHDPTMRVNVRRVRLVPETKQPLTQFPALPLDLPLDYYEPTFFNSLSYMIRAKITNNQVAFVPGRDPSLGAHPDELISDEKFQSKYLQEALLKYNTFDAEGEFTLKDLDVSGDLEAQEKVSKLDGDRMDEGNEAAPVYPNNDSEVEGA